MWTVHECETALWQRYLLTVHTSLTETAPRHPRKPHKRQKKTNQQQVVWTHGWNPGLTHIHKTGCWKEWKPKHASSQRDPKRHVVVIIPPTKSVMPLLPFSPLFTSSIYRFNSPSQHHLGSFSINFFFSRSLSPLFACISWSSKASKRTPRSLQIETWRLPIYSIFPRATFYISVQ